MNNHFNKRGRNHQRRRQGVNPNRALDSNGPDVRIRGTAQQIYDKYQALARDASSSGDRVKAENYLQHAEHYFRVLRAIQGPQAPAPDQHAGDNMDFDGEQPSITDPREQRQPAAQADGDDGDQDGSDSRMTSSNGAEARDESENSPPDDRQQEQRAQSGEAEGGRRRRRRPRRPREEGASEDAAEDAEPASVS